MCSSFGSGQSFSCNRLSLSSQAGWGSPAATDTREQSRSLLTPPLFQSFHGVSTLDLLFISARTYSIWNNQAFCNNSKSQPLFFFFFLLWLAQKIRLSKQNSAYIHSPFRASESHRCSCSCTTSCNGRLKREDTPAGKTHYASVRSFSPAPIRLNNFKDLAKHWDLSSIFFPCWKFSGWTSQASYCEVKEKNCS